VKYIKKFFNWLNNKEHKSYYMLIFIILVITAFFLIGLLQQSIKLVEYIITFPLLPNQFDGYKIVHISDFHGGLFKGSAADIIKKTANQSPNIVCLTGDIVDSTMRDFSEVEELISVLSKIAPLYAVSGNNEHFDPAINEKMEGIYLKYGAQLMDGKTIDVYYGGSKLTMSGIADPRNNKPGFAKGVAALKEHSSEESFEILLYHRANDYDRIAEAGYDLVLSGHTHGGIIRLPLIGGLLSPDGELFPKYSGGLYEVDGSWLVSNQGIADNNRFPRVYNPPVIVTIVLHSC